MTSSEQKLTRDFCLQNRIVFYPKTVDEAIFIQERLADLGIRWVDGDKIGARAQDCASKGMLVQDGKLYHSPQADQQNILCTSDQFGCDYMPPDRKFLMEQFSKLAQRVERMERKIDEMHAALFPAVEDTKKGIKRPGP